LIAIPPATGIDQQLQSFLSWRLP